MKIAVIVVRVLMGLLFLFASVSYFFKLFPQPELQGGVKEFMEGVMATGYLMNFIKLTELTCALSFISGRMVTLATVLIFPITINIFLFHLFLAPEGLIMSILLLAANLFMAYANRKQYISLFVARMS